MHNMHVMKKVQKFRCVIAISSEYKCKMMRNLCKMCTLVIILLIINLLLFFPFALYVSASLACA